MRYLLRVFAPGCDTKSWYVLPRKESRTRTEKPLGEWCPMNDEPIIRLEPRRSRHGPNENPRRYTVILRSMLRPRLIRSTSPLGLARTTCRDLCGVVRTFLP